MNLAQTLYGGSGKECFSLMMGERVISWKRRTLVRLGSQQVIRNFNALTEEQKQDLLNFLRSL